MAGEIKFDKKASNILTIGFILVIALTNILPRIAGSISMPYIIVAVVVFLFLITLRQINQYQRGVMYTMGRFSCIKEPGWRMVVPIFQSTTKVDMRIKAVDVP